LYLSAAASSAWIDNVYSGNTLSGRDQRTLSFSTSLAKRFPALGGVDAKLAFSHGALTRENGDGSAYASYTPALSLSLSLPLLRNFLGRADRSRLEQARLAVKIADLSEEEAYKTLIHSLSGAYLHWALAERRVAVYRDIQGRAAALADQTLRRFRLGVADQADLALANQNHLSYKARWLTSRDAAFSRYLDVLALMGLPIPEDAVPEVRAWSPVLDWETLPAVPEMRRLDELRVVQLAGLFVEEARQADRYAFSEALPELNLVTRGGLAGSREALPAIPGELDMRSFHAGLEFSVPLPGTDDRQVARAAAQALRATEARYAETRLAAAATLRRIAAGLATAREGFAVRKSVIEASQTRLTAILQKYQQGRVTLSQVTDARDALANAELARLEQSLELHLLDLEYAALTDALTRRYPLRPE
jgi:outer membrane protein